MSHQSAEESIATALARLRQRGGGGSWREGGVRRRGGRGGRGSSGAERERGGPALRRLVACIERANAALSVSDIAIEIGVDQPRASRLVAQGVELGLLQREADPDDARRTRIALTDSGREHSAHLREAHRASVDAALADFTEAEREQLASLLGRFAEAWQQGRERRN